MSGLLPELREEIQQGYRDFLALNKLQPRLGQKQMIAAIANELAGIELSEDGERHNQAGCCVVEAGTGTGKTVAYLLAALPIARQMEKKLVISTGTVALQEQLVNRDIPALLASTGWDCEVVLAKGRGRYLCPLRLEQCLDAMAAQNQGLFLFEDEINFDSSEANQQCYRDMADALETGSWDGDRDSWPEQLEPTTWQPLTVDRRQCGGRRCKHYQVCPFYQSRDQLEEADCIVANHDLVLADLSLGGGVILSQPADTLYIFDEAHRLASTTLSHFSASCRLETTIQQFSKIQQTLGKQKSQFDDDLVIDALEKCVKSARFAEESIALVLPLCREIMQAGGSERYRFTGGRIDQGLQDAAINCANKVGVLVSRLSALQDSLASLMQQQPDDPVVEQFHQQSGLWLGRAENAAALWHFYAEEFSEEAPPVARWITHIDTAAAFDIELSASPTHPGHILDKQLYQRAFAVVMTSATLQALGNFKDFLATAGLPEYTSCHKVAGVFDYANAATLVIPRIGADGGNPEKHTEAIAEYLPGTITESEGTLVLFSSRQQMEAVWALLDESLQQQILMQYAMSNQRLLDMHRSRIDQEETSIIFGLASFAEGVDLPGKYCAHVIIAKLPFAVPDDPVQGTLSDWLEAKGENPFMRLMLPEASLKLNQACGRLLRNEQDTGRITILDRRIVTRRYGQALLNGLPPFRREVN